MLNCGFFDQGVSTVQACEERHYRDSEIDARGTWLEQHTGSARAGVEVERIGLDTYQLQGSRSELEAPPNRVTDFQIRSGCIEPSRGATAFPKEIDLNKLGAVSPTSGSRLGYNTALALDDEIDSITKASSHHWSPEQYNHCIYALAAIFELWAQQLAVSLAIWNCTIVSTLSAPRTIQCIGRAEGVTRLCESCQIHDYHTRFPSRHDPTSMREFDK